MARTTTQRMTPVENPPWVTKQLADHWVWLESKVPPAWLPRLDHTIAKGNRMSAAIPEYGCGAYGCVFPTLDPKIVLKVTTDSTEAEFSAKLAGTLPVPICTIYRMVVHLKNAKRHGRKIYLLWRETAESVGDVDKVVGLHAEDAIERQHAAAQQAFQLLAHTEPAEEELATWVSLVEDMAIVPELAYLSDGLLRAYHERGIFFGDIHGGNLGLCQRGDTAQWCITDPGHVAVVERGRARTSRMATMPASSPVQNPREPNFHARTPTETTVQYAARVRREHQAMINDDDV